MCLILEVLRMKKIFNTENTEQTELHREFCSVKLIKLCELCVENRGYNILIWIMSITKSCIFIRNKPRRTKESFLVTIHPLLLITNFFNHVKVEKSERTLQKNICCYASSGRIYINLKSWVWAIAESFSNDGSAHQKTGWTHKRVGSEVEQRQSQ